MYELRHSRKKVSRDPGVLNCGSLLFFEKFVVFFLNVICVILVKHKLTASHRDANL